MARTFDTIVVGSGFGGAVMACRLAEKGASVLVLERGRRWDVQDFPRRPGDAWVWDQQRPHRCNGWIDFRCFPLMAVAQGAGVGGGSLIYANIVVDAPKYLFEDGWPPEITWQELQPYYERVARMMNVQTVPENQHTERFKLVKEAAEKIGCADRFRPLPLAVTFDPEWHYGLDDPFNFTHSTPWVNPQGQKQGTCVHCGNCCIGCPVKAKNTLDLNYIPRAEQHGAEVRPLHLVTGLEPEGDGYRVHFERLDNRRRVPGSESARRVVLAAGSLNSTELLLRCRDQFKTLPALSPFLGYNWSSNGDFLTPALYRDRTISPTHGPTISAAIDFLDGSRHGERFFVEDGGYPDVVAGYLEKVLQSRAPTSRRLRILVNAFSQLVRTRDPQRHIMPWFAQGIDASDGRLSLRRAWWAPWRRRLRLNWRYRNSQAVFDGIVAMHKQLTAATGGRVLPPLMWTMLKTLVTPHPLGGCNMGTSPENGVVNHAGQVFGHPGLYVADGAIIPKAIGRNPSKTIAALAERCADQIDC